MSFTTHTRCNDNHHAAKNLGVKTQSGIPANVTTTDYVNCEDQLTTLTQAGGASK